MAARLILAVTADRKVGAARQPGDELEQPLGGRLAHLAPVAARKLAPAGVGPRLGERPAHELLARRKLRHPDVVEIALSVIGLAHAARRSARGADTQSLLRLSRAA